MPRIPLLSVDDLDDEGRDVARRFREKNGFDSSAGLLLQRVPGLQPALRQLADAVLVPGKVGMELKWFVGYVSSMAAGCRFCSAHTASFAHQFAGTEPDKVTALWNFETSDRFTDSERAALRVAAAAGRTPNEVTDEQFAELRRHFDDDEILELVAVIAFYGFFNRWNDTLATPLEEPPLLFAEQHLREIGWDPPYVSTLAT
jgi:uncharacterized peroxidase-related enzyme